MPRAPVIGMARQESLLSYREGVLVGFIMTATYPNGYQDHESIRALTASDSSLSLYQVLPERLHITARAVAFESAHSKLGANVTSRRVCIPLLEARAMGYEC